MFSKPLPGIQDFLDIYGKGIVGGRDEFADVREGSVYDYPGGVAAILWSREAQRDEDLFAADYLDTADGDALTALVADRYGIERYLDTAGTGTAYLSRPNAGAGGGTVWAGTRISIIDTTGRSEPIFYEVSEDTIVGNSSTFFSVPIQATFTGLGAKIDATSADVRRPRVEDILWDSTIVASRLTCTDGTVLEPPDQLRARVRQTRRDQRTGYPKWIVQACNSVGATRVALFRSDYNPTDTGLNVCYVGDNGYNATPALLNACRIAIESAVVCGTSVQVLPMASQALKIVATVYLIDSPTEFNLDALTIRLQNALVAYAGLGFTYSIDELRGAMIAASSIVQDSIVTTPASDGTVLQSYLGAPNFPATLTRYTLRAEDITLTFAGPQ